MFHQNFFLKIFHDQYFSTHLNLEIFIFQNNEFLFVKKFQKFSNCYFKSSPLIHPLFSNPRPFNHSALWRNFFSVANIEIQFCSNETSWKMFRDHAASLKRHWSGSRKMRNVTCDSISCSVNAKSTAARNYS